MNKTLVRMIATLVMPVALAMAVPQAASANATSTAIWAAAAATIIGAILYDSNHRPYWRDSYGRRHYVSQGAAQYYNQHQWNHTPPGQRRWQDQRGSWHHGGCC